jgi:glycyl-tRNA synthetase beta chain
MPTSLLVEVRVEELPAPVVGLALEHLRKTVVDGLAELGLAPEGAVTLGTPRRLALFVERVGEGQADREEVRRGPSVKAGVKPGATGPDRFTPAALGFARSAGVAPDALTEKEGYLHARVLVKGRAARELLPELLTKALRTIPFPKTMRWRGKEFPFSRPVRALVAVLGGDVVPWQWAGLEAGRRVTGHPYLARESGGAPRGFELARADRAAYVEGLSKLAVVVDPAERRRLLAAKLEALAPGASAGAVAGKLLDEVVQMIEWPNALEGRFDAAFLELPPEVIVAVLKNHQRYFPVAGAAGKLENRFLSAIDRRDESAALVREGNERVVRARLSDARFFLKDDAKKTLGDRVEALKGVMYLEGLGTLFQRAGRLRALAGRFARAVGDAAAAETAERAAGLCKADLVTDMVREIPELQGVIGREYALRFDREGADVARAIEEHYQPRGSGDPLPESAAGTALALAERFDHLAGGFLKGFVPTGSKDPFGVRRAALGALRILEERRLRLPVREAVEAALEGYRGVKEAPAGMADQVLEFLRERLNAALRDEGKRHDLVEAALASSWADVPDLLARLEALEVLAGRAGWERLVIAVERTHNITKGAGETGEVREDLLKEPEEKELWAALREAEPRIAGLFRAGKYMEGGEAYAGQLGDPLHRFFDKVFVNVEDQALRANRMALLRRANRLFSSAVADLSRVVRPKS